MSALYFKVHNEDGEHVASFMHSEDSASFIALLGDGATIRVGPLVVWREGRESQPASESYDFVAGVVHDRMEMERQRLQAARAGR